MTGSENEYIYDLMITSPSESFSGYRDNVIHFLKMFNKD